ASIQFVIGLRL
ncbi:hypothetical protein HID58_051582, partial [Brassica napus]